ncbi:unnamed protein product [Rotaria sp. Silwood2]|nr:unnamed protein product [Rotaria sp. Silwood2]CAF4652345.1 unnamed protein product [Rotaria sp. Silwood2]
MNSTFLIKSVQLDENNIWNIQLKLVDNIWDIDFGERSIFSPNGDQIVIRHLSKENEQFIAFKLLLDMILRLDQTKYSKDELLEFCRSKYANDPIEIKKIKDFEDNYESNDAVKWYTKNCFLYRLLNQSLRTEIINSIVKMRYYIYDVHNQLAQLQSSFIESLNGQTNLILYRGQTMAKNELDKIRENCGSFISMNSFLSATQEKQVAVVFSGDGETSNPNEVSVIYEMMIDTNIRSTPYAKIKSFIPDEEEILFSMGPIFRIEHVDESDNHVSYVKLTMVHLEDELWNKLTKHLN